MAEAIGCSRVDRSEGMGNIHCNNFRSRQAFLSRRLDFWAGIVSSEEGMMGPGSCHGVQRLPENRDQRPPPDQACPRFLPAWLYEWLRMPL